MKQLFFNDGRTLETQSVTKVGEDKLHIRVILTTSEQLKALVWRHVCYGKDDHV